MAGGRPPLGPAIVDELDLPEEQKKRARAILEVIAGEKTVEQACEVLGIGRAQFYELRRQGLRALGEGLAPKPAGRKPAPVPTEADERIRELERQLREVKLERHAAEIRAEIAETLPDVAARRRSAAQKKRRRPW